jgi:hypothetical protein
MKKTFSFACLVLLSACGGSAATQAVVSTPTIPISAEPSAAEIAQQEAEAAIEAARRAEEIAQAEQERVSEAFLEVAFAYDDLRRDVIALDRIAVDAMPNGGRARFEGFGCVTLRPLGVDGASPPEGQVTVQAFGPADIEYLFRYGEFSGSVDLEAALIGEHHELDEAGAFFPETRRLDVDGTLTLVGEDPVRRNSVAFDYAGDFNVGDRTFSVEGRSTAYLKGEAEVPVNGNTVEAVRILSGFRSGDGISDGELFDVSLNGNGTAYR